MFTRRFRLPSPALVVSMVALCVVLGGSVAAASTATHSGNKAIVKLIKKLAPSLSVKHAKTAGSATTATSATNLGGHPGGFYAAAVLQSGQSESGTYYVVGGSDFAGEGFSFPHPLAAALDASHVVWLHGTTTTSCPGVGQAAAGYLCVYAAFATGLAPDDGHAVNTREDEGGADTYGFILAFDVTGVDPLTYGSWTVTAP
jgi:hypothetical protein